MKKEYEIVKTQNGFIISFKHTDNYFNDENKYVAKTLQEIVKIISKDITFKEPKSESDKL